MHYLHIVFDIDGTMTDTEKPLMISLQDTVQRFLGKHMTLEELRFAFGIPGDDTYNMLGITDKQAAAAHWQEKFQAYADQIQLFPGIREMLISLKDQGYTLGIITSKTHEEFEGGFTQFGLNDLFTLVVCADDTAGHKPDPDPMRYYLKQMNVQPHDVLYVGDTTYDMQCCHGAGVDGALACWGNPDWEQVPAEHHPISPEALLALLNRT
ncbi:HAD family hydrolase [Eubacteriales bacterium OttesenSCG-928-N13]|nr:HAD family hydrolase [Eubacteriales bacterium OttesenSCG-928-N13]